MKEIADRTGKAFRAKMLRLILVILAVLTIDSTSFAQNQDSLSRSEPDSTSRWYSGNKIAKQRLKVVPFIVPTLLMGYGFAALYENTPLSALDENTKAELQEDHPLFAAKADNYLQIAPAVALYALNFSGVKGKHNLLDASMLYLTSTAIMGLSTHVVKNAVGRARPDLRGNNSFPSGHTASAFAAAEFLHQEYKDVNPWIGYAGYFVATATGTLRMYNNRHWFSDVVAGAGFGIASTKISYWVYPYIKSLFTSKETSNIVLMPMYGQGTKGLIFSARF